MEIQNETTIASSLLTAISTSLVSLVESVFLTNNSDIDFLILSVY